MLHMAFETLEFNRYIQTAVPDIKNEIKSGVEKMRLSGERDSWNKLEATVVKGHWEARRFADPR